MFADMTKAETEVSLSSDTPSIIDSERTGTVEKEIKSVFEKDVMGEQIETLKQDLAVQRLIVQERIKENKELKRKLDKARGDTYMKVKKVNDIWKYRIYNEGTRSGIMLKRALQSSST